MYDSVHVTGENITEFGQNSWKLRVFDFDYFYAQFDSGFSPRQPETEILLKHEKYIKFENSKKRLFVLVGNATNSWLKCRGN